MQYLLLMFSPFLEFIRKKWNNKITKTSDFIERKITLVLFKKDVKHNTETIRFTISFSNCKDNKAHLITVFFAIQTFSI